MFRIEVSDVMLSILQTISVLNEVNVEPNSFKPYKQTVETENN